MPDPSVTRKPSEIVGAILANPTDLNSVRELVAPDAEYMIVTIDNPEVKRLIPWAGAVRAGPEHLVATYAGVLAAWKQDSFEMEDVIEDDEQVAMFGRFSYRSVTLGKPVTSPLAIYARVKDGRVTHMRFMEDSYSTIAALRVSGRSTYRPSPDGGEVEI